MNEGSFEIPFTVLFNLLIDKLRKLNFSLSVKSKFVKKSLNSQDTKFQMLLKMRGCLRGVGESSRLLYTLAAGEQPAVVVGVHQGEADNTFTLTPAGSCSFFIIK